MPSRTCLPANIYLKRQPDEPTNVHLNPSHVECLFPKDNATGKARLLMSSGTEYLLDTKTSLDFMTAVTGRR